MKPSIYPLKGLPAGLTGHLEVADIRAKRDWRDIAIGWAAFVVASIAAGFLLFELVPLGMVMAILLVSYVAKAMDQVRVFTRGDSCVIKTVVERDASSGASEARIDVDGTNESAA